MSEKQHRDVDVLSGASVKIARAIFDDDDGAFLGAVTA